MASEEKGMLKPDSAPGVNDPPPTYEQSGAPSQISQVLDQDVLASLPKIRKVEDFILHGASAWAKAYRIDAELADGAHGSYFMKLSMGDHGRDALKGEFEGTKAIYSISPEFTPEPIAWGTYKSVPDTYFYVCKFHDLELELPDPEEFCSKLAALHRNSNNSDGRYGFHVTTYNGDIPQKNDWQDSWETFFSEGLKHIFKLNFERGGPCQEFEELMPSLFEKVIPRLLRPLETGGNSIKASLVHGDLWNGNVAVDTEADKPIIFDPSSFWAHNEYELGNWRPERNKFSRTYFKAYHDRFPKAEPKEDYDDRNALYAMRFNLHAATLFPSVADFREMVVDEMRRLIQKYPGGYGDWIGKA